MTYDSYEDFLKDEKGVHEHLDKYAHVYNPNPFTLGDFLREIDRMSHEERITLIKQHNK